MGYQIHIDIFWPEGSQPQSQELRQTHMRLLLPWTTLLCCNGLKKSIECYCINCLFTLDFKKIFCSESLPSWCCSMRMLGSIPSPFSPEWCEGGTTEALGKRFSFPLLTSFHNKIISCDNFSFFYLP